jgi:hypothetical protein
MMKEPSPISASAGRLPCAMEAPTMAEALQPMRWK